MAFFNSLILQFKAFLLALFIFAQVLAGAISAHSIVTVTPPALTQPASSTPVTAKTAATSTAPLPKTTTVLASTKNIAKTVVAPPPAATTPAAPATLIPTEQLNDQTRPSLVNILCTTKAGGAFAPISGSGIIIDTRGIILTNAHVGQFFLLRDYGSPGNIQCIVRTGSPATPTYTAVLLYLPPPWINANASQITSQQGMGTGENDYSFLLITGSVSSGTTLPASFPALSMSSNSPHVGDPVFLAAYPAGFLGGATIQENLYASSAVSTVQELYTFDNPANVDLVSLGGTVVAQSGSSGGAVVSAANGKLIGLIATESTGTTTSSRDLNAITLAHINRSLTSLGLGGITGLLSGDLQQQAAGFEANIAPAETALLEAELNKAAH